MSALILKLRVFLFNWRCKQAEKELLVARADAEVIALQNFRGCEIQGA